MREPYVRQLKLGPMDNFVYLVGPRHSDEVVVVDRRGTWRPSSRR